MGCCVSTETNRSSHSQPPRSTISRAPPPPLIDEETVKEVLSETPKWNPPPTFSKFQPQQPHKPKTFHTEMKNYEDDDADALFATMATTKPQEISQLSEEVCSLSESVSTTTFNEEETRQRVVNRSPARTQKNRSFSGDFAARTVGKSPVRRSEQSPARRNGGSVRLVQSRDQMGNGLSRNQTRRRDAGENSSRRSMSPATRTDNGATRSVVGRSPSKRRGTNQSPARVRQAPAPAVESGDRKMDNPAMEEGKWSSSANNESLENPLVSLECFIFL
ncbi:hypothetical protein HN51_057789 [Arachis hypogaea]|uniref:Uncharacterized protein n=2 Tax=Arachis hypogaea TaxID=3818 RepID=A0A444WYD0_ARAHY|nr:uncharacterized protein LOC107624405 isoform X1 [Arachis ipaensis]QHN80892.1 uncharacterized protein DS421_20g682110 [Arachis hypogaea]RYQ82411.1 hypothetical protein Ahy_B10g101004 [Arachis hypogaea]